MAIKTSSFFVKNSNLVKTKIYFYPDNPLSRFPQGGKARRLLPPWGKVGKGVLILKTEKFKIHYKKTI